MHACMHVCVCVYACLYVCMHACICLYVCMYVGRCVCPCVCMNSYYQRVCRTWRNFYHPPGEPVHQISRMYAYVHTCTRIYTRIQDVAQVGTSARRTSAGDYTRRLEACKGCVSVSGAGRGANLQTRCAGCRQRCVCVCVCVCRCMYG